MIPNVYEFIISSQTHIPSSPITKKLYHKLLQAIIEGRFFDFNKTVQKLNLVYKKEQLSIQTASLKWTGMALAFSIIKRRSTIRMKQYRASRGRVRYAYNVTI